MKCRIVWTLSLSIFLMGSFATGDDKKPDPPKDPYAELFSFPAKITLDEKQKQKLAALRKAYEPRLAMLDKSIASYPPQRFRDKNDIGPANSLRYRAKVVRAVIRQKNAILTEEQRGVLGVEILIPSFAEAKALNDEKIWDLSQLEKIFIIQSRSFDPEEQLIAFNVITKRKWTEKERKADDTNWTGMVGGDWTGMRAGADGPAVKVIFYNKQEETSFELTGPCYNTSVRAIVNGEIWRRSLKLTEKQQEEGLLRFRIYLDLDDDRARGREAATVKFVYLEPK